MDANAKKEKKEKKEKKFNSERVARQVKKSLEAVFPKDKFIVSNFTDRVEIMYSDATVCSLQELNMFCILYCKFGNLKKEQLQVFKIKKEPAAPAPAPAASK